MRIYNINPFNLNFIGKRQDRKTVEQLRQPNSYDLNYINQRKISQAIENLAEIPGEDNVNFLLDVSENLQYGTNIDLGKNSFNDWHVKLNNAAQKAISESPEEVQEQLLERLKKATPPRKSLNEDEKEILELRDSILSQVDENELEKIENKNVKALNKNLDYFIISSEVPLAQKLYIMKRLNYFISPEYKIDSQLTNHKTQALAEIINDITINTPESDIPNIKAVNQKLHGMCAAISIARKALAYEDKANFVDMVMSELDDSPYLMVYDITKLGSKTRVPINKTELDFKYALDMGYRIIDTSAMYWMQAADTTGVGEDIGMYTTFDKENFDLFQDSHLMPYIKEQLNNQQDYYRSLLKAKNILEKYKKQSKKSKQDKINEHQQINNNIKQIQKLSLNLTNILQEISPSTPADKLKKISTEIVKLEIPTSEKANKVSDYRKDFVYLPNETDSAKIEKIKAFLSIALDKKDNEMLDKNAEKILSLTTIINNVNKSQPVNLIAQKINRAEALYQAAAAYRIQNIFGLYIPERLNDLTISMNIPDRETRIAQNMEYLIQKIEKGKLNPKIQETLANNFDVNNDKEELIEALNTNKDAITLITTQVLDDFYKSILSVNRKNVLLNEITATYNTIKENSDKVILQQTASSLKIDNNKNKVLETLDKFINTLKSEKCTEQEYITIYNKFGKKNQMQDFKETYERLGEALFKDKNEDIIKGFNALHGLNPDASIEETANVYKRIGDQFNNVSLITTQLQNALEVRDENDEILNTVIASEIITKKLENIGEIIPAKDLKKLQKRFAAINRELTNNNGKQKKLKDLPPELTKFSKAEKELLNNIESKINGWYSHTSRLLDLQYKLIKEPLDELHRQVGVKSGYNWISEGHSGLNATQQIQIIEQMTDRPYYIETNGRLAVRKIKNSPYSGISGTSVDHKRPAMHAQYISDIKPVKIGDKTEEVLFHDNTWGPKEHANTWTDENGLLRTDYNNEYGGELGYITNEKYQNGKLLNNLFSEIGQTGKTGEEYKFPMLTDILTPGRYPNAGSYVRQIRQNTILNPLMYFDELENYAKNMSRDEILQTINKTKTLGKNTYDKYLNIENKIFGNPPIEKGIITQDDYDKLSDNDALKILLEKVALSRSFSGIPDSKFFYKKTNMNELRDMKNEIRKEARKNFSYTFGKNPEITKFGTESVRSALNKQLENLAKENGFKLSVIKTINIVNSLNRIPKDKFDGNLDTTIELMTDSFRNYLIKHTPEFENKNKKIEDIANNVRTMLRTNMGFTLADLNKTSSGITKWIDDVFSPSTDEEFVQIFKKLQKMTTEEFNAKYNSKITDEAMGIKPVTGFDIVRQFRVLDESVMDAVFNMLFNEELGYTTNLSKTVPSYDYTKTNRILRGAYYQQKGRSFDDIYLDYYFSLLSLNRYKQYDKLKTMAFKDYGMFPAYPKVEHESKEDIEKCIQEFFDDIVESTQAIDAFKVQDQSFKMVEQLKKYSQKLNDSTPVSPRQEKYIKDIIYKFLQLNGEDTSVKNTIDSALKIMELEPNTNGSEYKKLIDIMFEELKMYSTTADGKTMTESIKLQIKAIKDKKREFVMNVIDPKYQNKAYELIDKWISAMAKNNPNADNYFADIEMFYDKHRIMKYPEKMFNEYLLLLAKPEPQNESTQKTGKQYSKAEEKQLEDVKDVYRTNIQSAIISANILEMQHILMNCAKEGNLNIVRDEFKNSQIMLNDGRIVNMDSNEGLAVLIKPLMNFEDIDTLVMFIEQLGLAERVVEMFTKDIKFDKVYKNIKRIDNIFLSVSKQTEIVQKELQKLGNIDNDPNYAEKLNITKENIIRKFKHTNYRRSIKIIEEAFKKIQEEIKEHPEHSKTAYVHLYMENAKTATLYIAHKQVEYLNMKLQAYQRIYDMLGKLKIRKDSHVVPLLKKYFDEVHKVEDFAASHTREYKNLDIKTGNYAL